MELANALIELTVGLILERIRPTGARVRIDRWR